MDETLRDKAISGAKWRLVTAYSTQALQVVSSVVLAWLLLPTDYGLVAAAMVVINLVRALGSLGMNYAIVQRRDRIEDATSTAFVLMLFVAAGLYGLLLVVSPLSSVHARAPWLVRAMGLLFFLRPMGVVTEGTLTRDFRFARLFVVEFLSVVLSIAGAVVLALVLPEGERYWALAISGLGRECLRSVAAWYFAKIRPALRFDWALARELLHYGKFFVGGAIVMALHGNLERLALSELLSIGALGLYHFAYTWVYRVGDVTETVFGSVSLAVYAKLQGDVPRLRESFCRIVRLSALLSTGLLTGMIVLVPEAVALAFPSRWLPTIPVFQTLGLWYIVRAVDTTTGQLYAGTGRPKYNLWLDVANLVVMAATVVPLVLWRGPVGAALCLLAARVVRLAFNTAICRRVLGCRLVRLAGIVTPAVKTALVMALVLNAGLVAAYRWLGAVGWVTLVALIALGSVSYALALLAFERELFFELLGLIRDALRGRKVRLNGAGS